MLSLWRISLQHKEENMNPIWGIFLISPSSRRQLVCSLMAEMAAALDRHSSPAVLEAAARTYLHLCGEGAAWGSVARAARDSLVESWVEHLKDLLKDSLCVRATVTQKSPYLDEDLLRTESEY